MRAVGGTTINKVHNKEQCLFACIKDVSNKLQVDQTLKYTCIRLKLFSLFFKMFE